ncbi:MAG: porin [bacterium]
MSAKTVRSRRRRARWSCVAAAVLLAALLAPAARAARWNWSGTATLDYKNLPGAEAQDLTKAGAVLEWSLKSTVDVSEKLSVTGRLCSACHGLTINNAYAEVHLAPLANFDAGRLEVPFGDYYQRHDPANDAFLSTPLPYAMGQMLRYQADRFNLGVLPMPYVDEGAVLFGDHWIHDTLQIWYALYGVNGFQSSVARDFTFKNQLSDGGFSDNNDDLAWGGRLSLGKGPLTAGASYLRGVYDPAGQYDYDVWGVDASVFVRGVQLRGEYLVRGADVVADDGSVGILRKKGFYLQAESPTVRKISLVARLDGLLREGPSLGTDNDESSGIVRLTGGFSVTPSPEYSLRFQFEHWRFTDFDETNVLHFGVVTTY